MSVPSATSHPMEAKPMSLKTKVGHGSNMLKELIDSKPFSSSVSAFCSPGMQYGLFSHITYGYLMEIGWSILFSRTTYRYIMDIGRSITMLMRRAYKLNMLPKQTTTVGRSLMSVVNVVAGQVTNQFLYRQNMSKTLYGRVSIVNGLPQFPVTADVVA